jgi:hypothetical protein
MKLIARNFDWYPRGSPAAIALSPTLKRCSEVRFPFRIGERNSNQFTFDFDTHLEAHVMRCGGESIKFSLPKSIKRAFDFVFTFKGKLVAAEVEKANKDKILYDFLKFHMYFRNKVDFGVLFLPKNWPHSNGEVNMFDNGIERYQRCVEFGLGARSGFDRILLVGYQQFTTQGELFTKEVRKQLIADHKRKADTAQAEH